MEITKEYLLVEIENMMKQRNHAHDVAVAAQAAIDVLQSLVTRIDMAEPDAIKLSDLGLPDPEPMERTQE
jgi:uncharacterized protein YutE (UPF0331/DUF86 family)